MGHRQHQKHQYWLQLKDLIHKLQPNCIFIANNAKDFQNYDIIGYEYLWLMKANPEIAGPPVENINVPELCDFIDSGGRWFWHTGEIKLQEAEKIGTMLKL